MFKKGDKVKIVSCEKSTYWYADKIGKEYTLNEYENTLGWNIKGDVCSYLKESDIELVKEEKEEMFGKKDLKTGYIIELVTFNRVQFAMVLLGTANGDIVAGETWFPLSSYTDEDLFGNNGDVKINKVYCPKTNADHAYAITKSLKGQISYCSLVWEREEKTEQQKQIEELEKTILLAQQQIEELKGIK